PRWWNLPGTRLSSWSRVSSVGQPNFARQDSAPLAARIPQQEMPFAVDAEHPALVCGALASDLDPPAGQDLPIAPRGQQRVRSLRRVGPHPAVVAVQERGSEPVAVDLAPRGFAQG